MPNKLNDGSNLDHDSMILASLKDLPSDEEIMQLKKEYLIQSEEYHEELTLLGEVAKQYYKGRQTGYDQLAIYESHAVENRLFLADETAIPLVTAKLPDINVIPAKYDETSVANANKTGDVIKHLFQETDLQHKAEISMRTLSQRRFYVWNVYWDSENDTIAWRVVPTRNVYFPRYANKVNGVSLPFVIEKMEYNVPDLVAEFGRDALNHVEQANSVGLLSSIVSFFTPSETMKDKRGMYVVWAVWTEKWVSYIGKDKPLKSMRNPYWDWLTKKKKETPEAYRKRMREANHFDMPKIPYIIGTAFEDGEETVGITSLYEQDMPMQDIINKTWRYMIDVMETVGDPKILIDSDVMSREESEQITSEPGRKYWGKDIANENKFRVMAPVNMPSYIPNILRGGQNAFDDIYGLHASTQGDGNNDTLGQDKLDVQQDNQRLDVFTRVLGRSMDELGNWFLQLIKMNWDEERDIPILSNADELGLVEGFSSEMLHKGMKFLTKPGSTLPDDKTTQANIMMKLAAMNISGIRPLDLYTMLGLPNPQGLEDNLVKWQKGQVGGAPSPSMVPQPGQPGGAASKVPVPAAPIPTA